MKLEPLQIRVYFIEWKEPCGIEGTVVIKYNLDLILIHVVFIREFDRSVNPLSCSSSVTLTKTQPINSAVAR